MNRRYRLKPALQRRPDGRPRSIPVEGLIFTGGDVVVTPMNLSQWVGALLVEVKDKPVKNKPAAVKTPPSPAPPAETPPVPPTPPAAPPIESPVEPDPPPVITTEGANLPFGPGEVLEPESKPEPEPKITRKRRSRKRTV